MKVIIEGKELEYCPQHGYPLPCDKCGLGLFELGKREGVKEVVEWIGGYDKPFPNQREWKAKLKEWGIERVTIRE